MTMTSVEILSRWSAKNRSDRSRGADHVLTKNVVGGCRVGRWGGVG